MVVGVIGAFGALATLEDKVVVTMMVSVVAMRAVVSMTFVATLDALPGILGEGLDAADHGGAVVLGGRGQQIDAADDDISGGSLDQLDFDSRNAANEAAANLDNAELDANNLEMLPLIHTLGSDGQAVAQPLLLGLSVGAKDISDEVAVPRVGVGVEFEAVQHESLAVALHLEVHLEVAVPALAMLAWHLDALRQGRGW